MIEQLIDTAESEVILESPWLRRVRAEAEQAGRAAGEQIGRAAGEQIGRAEGEQIGLVKGESLGRLKTLRETILEVAVTRLEMSALVFRQLQLDIDMVDDEARLLTLLRTAIAARDVNELLAAVTPA